LTSSKISGIFEKRYRGAEDLLGSGYLQPISELCDSGSTTAIFNEVMLAPLQTLAGGFCVLIWKTLLAFLLSKDEFFLDY